MFFYYVGNQRYRSRIQKYIVMKSKDLIVFFYSNSDIVEQEKIYLQSYLLIFSSHILITISIVP